MRRHEHPRVYQLLGVLYPGDESGSILIMVALSLLVLLGLCALGFETARWYWIHA